MNALRIVCLAAVAACSRAQLPWYSGLYGAYPGLLPGYGSGMSQPAMRSMTAQPINIQSMLSSPMAYNMAPFASMAPIRSQYSSQDEFGQYSFGYDGGFTARSEMRDAFGNVRGSYNYVDSDGKLQTTNYVADSLGFRVQGTNLAEAAHPKYTNEVAAARAAHLAAHNEAAAVTSGSRQRRSVMAAPHINPFLRSPYGFSTPFNYANPSMMGSALPYMAGYSNYAVAPGITAYSGLPGFNYAAAAPAAAHDAEMLRIENNPGHSVSYRVY